MKKKKTCKYRMGYGCVHTNTHIILTHWETQCTVLTFIQTKVISEHMYVLKYESQKFKYRELLCEFFDYQYLRATLHQWTWIHMCTHIFLSTYTCICSRADSFRQCVSIISFRGWLSIISFPQITRSHSHQGAFPSATICHFRCGTAARRSQSIELFGTPVPCCGPNCRCNTKICPTLPNSCEPPSAN